MRCLIINVCILLLFLCIQGNAQYDNIWAFGQGNEGAGLDFSMGSPVPIKTNIYGWGEANASICDANGSLLFYTNGDAVWNRNHNMMPNGHNLTGLPTSANGEPPCTSTTQGTLIAPIPGSSSKYYIFSLTDQNADSLKGRLYYSIVDMDLDAGFGNVESGSKGVLLDSNLTEKMTAIVGNHCNIWLIVYGYLSNAFRVWEITSEGIAVAPVISNTGNFTSSAAVGMMVASPDRTKLLVCSYRFFNGRLQLYDFNPTTGEVYSSLILDSNVLNRYYGGAFSPDGTKIYVTGLLSTESEHSLLQYDLNAGNPVNSRTELGKCFGSALRLGPDGKIYIHGRIGPGLIFPRISFVRYPNLTGIASGYIENVIVPLSESKIHVGFPNIVPIIWHDSLFSRQLPIIGPCFATGGLNMQANDTTGWDYVWNTGVIGKEGLADTPGTYWVSYHTPPCTYHVDTFHVRFPNGVLPDIQVNPECRSDNNGYAYASTYPGDPVSYSYTWMRGTDTLSLTDTLAPVPSGSYSLHVQTDTGCDTLLFFDIPEEDFRVSFTVSDTLICLGDTIQLINTSDAHFTTYHWSFDNGDTSALPTLPVYVYPESGAYRLMLAGAGEICKDTAYQTILVDQPLSPALEVEPQEVCVGQPVYFYPKTDSTTVQLAWDMEEQLRIESHLQRRYQHGFAASGTFPVTLSVASRACPDTSIADSVRVYPFPELDLGSDSSICLHGAPVYLKNRRSAPLNPHHYLWSTGDTTATLKVVHPGIYTLSVTTEPIGCTTTESIAITKDCYIDIPNGFTPNGDGHNDYFFPRQLLSGSVSSFHMQVFNRWGQVIFETTNLDGRGWDGRFNDKAQPMGVYLYRIEVGFTNGWEEQYEGNVTLIR